MGSQFEKIKKYTIPLGIRLLRNYFFFLTKVSWKEVIMLL